MIHDSLLIIMFHASQKQLRFKPPQNTLLKGGNRSFQLEVHKKTWYLMNRHAT